MNKYRVDLKSDSGPVTVYLWAESITKAIEIVLKDQKAPKSAITFYGAVPKSKKKA